MKKLSIAVILGLVLIFTASAQNARADAGLSGKVVETMNSGGYTYVRLEKNGKKMWVAVSETKVVKGQNMAFKPGAEMVNFESKTLKRKFDRIIFSGGPITAREAAAEVKTTGSKGKTVAPTGKVRVEKAVAANAYTISDLYKNSAGLNNQTVVVKGKVVKVSSGIMQRNWIHLQDGTGDQKKGTHNLVVTSSELPSMGDVVTASGTFFKDKDFGAGYKYAAIVENATFTK